MNYSGSSPEIIGSLLYLIIVIPLMILFLSSFWKIFVKAGRPGWVSLIPVYNNIVLLQISKKSGWLFLLFFVPIINIILSFLMAIWLAKAFGKSILFAIAFLFLIPVGYLIIAFDKSKYVYFTNVTQPTPPVSQPPTQQPA